jgi:hypothetical protein
MKLDPASLLLLAIVGISAVSGWVLVSPLPNGFNITFAGVGDIGCTEVPRPRHFEEGSPRVWSMHLEAAGCCASFYYMQWCQRPWRTVCSSALDRNDTVHLPRLPLEVRWFRVFSCARP